MSVYRSFKLSMILFLTIFPLQAIGNKSVRAFQSLQQGHPNKLRITQQIPPPQAARFLEEDLEPFCSRLSGPHGSTLAQAGNGIESRTDWESQANG
jgi:hypothetical protein